MQNSVVYFIMFSIGIVAIYYIWPMKYRRLYLILSSAIFYLLCDKTFILLIISETIYSYRIARWMQRKPEYRRKILIFGMAPIVGALLLFKYLDFFSSSICGFLGIEGVFWENIIMPLGISYYSFKMISYLIDIYRGKYDGGSEWQDYFLYILFFPQIICGPISRFEELSLQKYENIKFNCDLFLNGILLIVSGMFKKMVIADRLSTYVNTIYSDYGNYPGLASLIVIFLYSVQLYCDFAGYSEIMVGVADLLGIECKANFNCPYFSRDIKEFWRRWHISLSSWLRDYIYISMGGSRCGRVRRKINLMVTFLVSGMWHGNHLNYIVWGLYHGGLNCFCKNEKAERGAERNKGSIMKIVLTFCSVAVGWTIFRIETISELPGFYIHMIKTFSLSMEDIQRSILPFTGDYSCLAYFGVTILAIVILVIRELDEWEKKSSPNIYVYNAIYVIFIVLFAAGNTSSFLYANF